MCLAKFFLYLSLPFAQIAPLHGRRRSFIKSAPPDEANSLYEYVADELEKSGVKSVKKGIFGADMKVDLLNDGPVTIILDSKELK